MRKLGENMRNHYLTLTGLAISVVVLLYSVISGLDLFELLVCDSVKSLERYEFDEFIIPMVIFSIFAFFDKLRREKNDKVEHEKTKIYKAMINSTHHILNNFLNQMMIFKLTADDTPGFDHKVLSLYEKIIEDATIQINALSSITTIDEMSIHTSVTSQSNT